VNGTNVCQQLPCTRTRVLVLTYIYPTSCARVRTTDRPSECSCMSWHDSWKQLVSVPLCMMHTIVIHADYPINLTLIIWISMRACQHRLTRLARMRGDKLIGYAPHDDMHMLNC
jgi:hypothetical protein